MYYICKCGIITVTSCVLTNQILLWMCIHQSNPERSNHISQCWYFLLNLIKSVSWLHYPFYWRRVKTGIQRSIQTKVNTWGGNRRGLGVNVCPTNTPFIVIKTDCAFLLNSHSTRPVFAYCTSCLPYILKWSKNKWTAVDYLKVEWWLISECQCISIERYSELLLSLQPMR